MSWTQILEERKTLKVFAKGDFLHDQMAKTSSSQCRGPGFNPCSGKYITHVTAKSSHTSTQRSHTPQLKKIRHAATQDPVCRDLRSSAVCLVVSNSCHLIDCRLPGSSVHVILQARILEWVTISFPRRSSKPRNWTWVSRIAVRQVIDWATREAKQINKINIYIFEKYSPKGDRYHARVSSLDVESFCCWKFS